MAATDLPGRPACCRDPESEDRTQVSAVDISRAYFNASTAGGPPTYVQFPPEHPDSGRDMCGFLLKHMYGTQAAADGWQQEELGQHPTPCRLLASGRAPPQLPQVGNCSSTGIGCIQPI